MSDTRIAIAEGPAQAHCELVVGKLAPRLISRTSRSAHVGLTAAEMLLLDSDVVDLQITVGTGCTLRLEEIGGTVAYPRRQPQAAELSPPAQWNTHIQLQPNARFIWDSLPFVLAAESEVHRKSALELSEGAAALMRETYVFGRHGETGGALRSEVSAQDPQGPVLEEVLAADASTPAPGILGAHRVFDSLTALGYSPDVEPGDLQLAHSGTMARWLGDATHNSALDQRFRDWEKNLLC